MYTRRNTFFNELSVFFTCPTILRACYEKRRPGRENSTYQSDFGHGTVLPLFRTIRVTMYGRSECSDRTASLYIDDFVSRSENIVAFMGAAILKLSIR